MARTPGAGTGTRAERAPRAPRTASSPPHVYLYYKMNNVLLYVCMYVCAAQLFPDIWIVLVSLMFGTRRRAAGEARARMIK